MKSPIEYASRDLVKTGIFGFDDILLGGILKGNVALVEGMPGTGKTTLGLEFLYRGAQIYDEPGIMITFEMSPQKILRDAAGFEWDFARLQEQGKLKIVYTSPAVLLDELQTHDGVLAKEMRQLGAKRLVIDGITPLRLFGEKLNGRSFRDSLLLLIETIQRTGATTFLTTETSGTNPIGETGSNHEHYVCDTIITLRNQARRRSVHRSIEVAKSRGQDFITGRHSLKIEAGTGVKVFPRVYSRPKTLDQQKTSLEISSTGIPAIDRMLGGGVYDGSITLVVGISGTGKTVTGVQFLVEGAERGKRGLMVTLDEHQSQISRNAGKLGLNLKQYLDDERIQLIFDSPLELDLDEHFDRIKRYVETHKIERVVIDSLAAYENAQPDEAREFICALSTYFKDNLITAFFNYESPELVGVSQISEELKASAIVDNIILLNYVEISTRLRRVITVPKSRGSDPEHESREYIIAQGGIALVDKYQDNEFQPVPQLPLTSYYGVLATAPTRRSPAIEESIAAGRPLPPSVSPIMKSGKKSRAAKQRDTN